MSRLAAGLRYACLYCVAATVLVGCESPSTNPTRTPEVVNAVAVTEAFLLAIGRADTAALRLHALPTARLMAVPDDEQVAPRVTELDEFLIQVTENAGRFLERMWAPQAQVDGRLAHVWTAYDFYRDGAFSHCGIDSFDLVRMGRQWKVASIVYTVHPDGCEPSPLGVPSPQTPAA